MQKPEKASEQPDLSKLFQAIYLNEQQVANTMRRIEKRQALFQVRQKEQNQHLAYNIIKSRTKEYIVDEKLLYKDRNVKTPMQMVNHLSQICKDESSQNAIKQTKWQIQKKQEQSKKVNNMTNINYTQHYSDEGRAVTGQEMISTLADMMAQDTAKTQEETKDGSVKMQGRDKNLNMTDRLGFHMGQLIMDEGEKKQIQELTEKTNKIEELLKGDVKKKFNPTEFRKIMSKSTEVGLLVDVGYKLLTKGLEVHNEKFQEKPPIKTKNKGKKPEVWSLPVRPNFGDYLPNRKGVQLSDFKEGKNDMFEMLLYALEQADRDLFLEFRSGQITLSQLIYRTQEMVTGKKIVVLDDVRHMFTNNARVAVDPELVMAYNENEKEQESYKDAQKRGISIKQLKKSEKHYNMQYRCSKSVFAPPKKRFEIAKQELQEQRDGYIKHDNRGVNAEQVEGVRQKKLARNWSNKWSKHEAHVDNMKLQSYKAKCQSTIDKQVETQLHGRKDFFLPQRLKDKIFEQFQELYEKECTIFEKEEVRKREEREMHKRIDAENRRKIAEREAEYYNQEKKKEAAKLKKQQTLKVEVEEEPRRKSSSTKKSHEQLDMKRKKSVEQTQLRINVIKTSQEKREKDVETSPFSLYTDFHSKQGNKNEESLSIIESAILVAENEEKFCKKISGITDMDSVPLSASREPTVSKEISSSRSMDKNDYVHIGEYKNGAEYVSRVTIVKQNSGSPYQSSRQTSRISQKNLKLSSRNSTTLKPSTTVNYSSQKGQHINNRSHATKRLRGGGFNQIRKSMDTTSQEKSTNYSLSQLKVPKSVADFYHQKFGKNYESSSSASDSSLPRYNLTSNQSPATERDIVNYSDLKRPKAYHLFKEGKKLTTIIPKHRGLRADQLTSVVAKHSRGLSEPSLGVYEQEQNSAGLGQQMKTAGSIYTLQESDSQPKVVSTRNSEKSRPYSSKVSRSTNRPQTGTGFYTHQKTLPASPNKLVEVLGYAAPRHLPQKSEKKPGAQNYLTGSAMVQPPSTRLSEINYY